MSLSINEQELLELRKAGAKIVSKTSSRPPAPAPTPKPSPFWQIATGLKQLSEALLAVAKRPNPASQVHVAPANVSVNPQVNVKTPRKWKVEVTERDSAMRIKALTIVAED